MSANESALGRHVRSLRHARGWTQERLAERCELSPDTIRRIERGLFSVSLATLRKLCVGFGMLLSAFFDGFEARKRGERRELDDLLATRSPRELELTTRLLRVLFDELDRLRDDDET